MNKQNLKVRLLESFMFGFIIALMMVVGYSLDKYHRVQEISQGLFIFPGALLLSTAIIFASLVLIEECFIRKALLLRIETFTDRLGSLRLTLIIWGIMLIFYIPMCRMTPISSISGDLLAITEMLQGKYAIGNHQPILYAMIWKYCMIVQDAVGIDGIALFLLELLQAVVFTYAISVCLSFMMVSLKRYVLTSVSLAGLLFSPFIKEFVVATNKDAFFSAMLVLLIKSIIEIVNDKRCMNDNGFLFRLFVISGFLCLFRNNGCIVLLLEAMALLWYYKKEAIKPCLVLGTVLMLFFMMVGPFFRHFEIANSPVHEKMSVPISQLANVYNNYNYVLSDSEKAQILEYMPNVDKYTGRIADHVKDTFNDVLYKSDKASFWKLWFKVLLKKPVAYIDGFLNLNLYFWYPRSSFLYSEFLPVLALFILFLVVMEEKRKTMCLALLPCVCLLLTSLLGPMVQYRYIMPITVSIPILTAGVRFDCYKLQGL